ncbi:replicative DNA helicase [Virgibacillus profundi]|uniref:Replicative DNA helicase n=1 Tax=Virgibacillus profundi TaxID=2024555 RepID=A0A2A2IGW2_9BACI|nr:replicative DNA helicase [Virgibacillus profundi]PAV30772.1 replicative DNA helicase [Virgibacillus profundi]PXY54955.1 replicative DNA helicase [Virgibacillus profundi]
MESINLEDLTSGYKDRMRRLALLDPLVELERKRLTDGGGKLIDMRGIGMLTLLFFFERRLTRKYKTGVIHLTKFLQEITRDTYKIERPAMERIARTMITTFRPSTGKKRQFTFFNWETKQEGKIEYSILKDNDFDAKTQTQYYALDEDGLELLFATKEFYSEFQISINQLLLKQQIKKGEFHGALRQIREMELDVDTLRENMEKMKLEILRSIVSEETFERYKKLLADTYLRFEREDEEFKALNQFIKETRDTLYTKDIKQKEQTSYQLIIKIAKELESVHYEHARLLELTAELQRTALATAQESLYYTGIQSFNFDQDIVSMILSKPLPPGKMKGIIHPFLRVEENRMWSPLSVFAEQNIVEERPEREAETFAEISEDNEEATYRKWIAVKYAELMKKFIYSYENNQANTLKQWMDLLEKTDPEILKMRYFYSFWLMMHQYSPLTYSELEEHDGQTILKNALHQIGSKQIIIEETAEILDYDPKYSIQNMKITLEEHINELS